MPPFRSCARSCDGTSIELARALILLHLTTASLLDPLNNSSLYNSLQLQVATRIFRSAPARAFNRQGQRRTNPDALLDDMMVDLRLVRQFRVDNPVIMWPGGWNSSHIFRLLRKPNWHTFKSPSRQSPSEPSLCQANLVSKLVNKSTCIHALLTVSDGKQYDFEFRQHYELHSSGYHRAVYAFYLIDFYDGPRDSPC